MTKKAHPSPKSIIRFVISLSGVMLLVAFVLVLRTLFTQYQLLPLRTQSSQQPVSQALSVTPVTSISMDSEDISVSVDWQNEKSIKSQFQLGRSRKSSESTISILIQKSSKRSSGGEGGGNKPNLKLESSS